MKIRTTSQEYALKNNCSVPTAKRKLRSMGAVEKLVKKKIVKNGNHEIGNRRPYYMVIMFEYEDGGGDGEL